MFIFQTSYNIILNVLKKFLFITKHIAVIQTTVIENLYVSDVSEQFVDKKWLICKGIPPGDDY